MNKVEIMVEFFDDNLFFHKNECGDEVSCFRLVGRNRRVSLMCACQLFSCFFYMFSTSPLVAHFGERA